LVGDSFLEGYYVPWPVSVLIERRWTEQGRPDAEAINLGVAATGPRQYYYRIKRVALDLHPDVIVMFVYAGNDFITTRLDEFTMPALAEELPVPSILGTIVPRTNWLMANRLGLSEIGRGNKNIPGESELLTEWAATPTAELTERVARHMQTYYYPKTSVDTIREILARGGERFQAAVEKRKVDRGSLAGWLLSSMIDWETGQWDMPHDAEEADRNVDVAKVEATLTGWSAPNNWQRRTACNCTSPWRPMVSSIRTTSSSGSSGQNTSVTNGVPTRATEGWRRSFATVACRSSICATTSTAFVAPIA
jgi:hypothetical protein